MQKTEAATGGVKKKLFLEISKNSEKNACARVSSLIMLPSGLQLLLKNRLWHRCFPVNFAKEHLRTIVSEKTKRVCFETLLNDFGKI